MEETKNIYVAMAAILKEVGPVGKEGTNASQHYSFRGIEQVCAKLSPLFAKHGMFVVPEVLEQQREIVDRYKDGVVVGKMYTTIARIKYTFYGPDGSSVSAVTIGEGSDFSDKASNKAMSAAMKYALVQTFCISDSQDEGDKDTPTPTDDFM